MPHANSDSKVPSAANGINGTTKHANGTSHHHAFDSIQDTIEAFSRGEFVIALDNPLRENEGDLILAAQHATPAKLSFMIRHTSGYICAPLSASRCAALDLPQMVATNKDPHRTAYTVSVDAAGEGVTTGISARDRAVTARALADPSKGPADFRRPGHVLPLRAKEGGVRERQGHTEAAVELCRLAGKEQAALICELVIDGEGVEGVPELREGGMMRRDDCLEFGKRWGIKVCTIEDLRRYVEEKEARPNEGRGGHF